MTGSWKYTAVGLVLGLTLGAAVAFLALRHGPFRHPPRSAEDRATRMVERFTDELELNAGQKAQISTLLETKRGEIRALDDEMRPRFQDIRRSIKDEIRKVLTPEQALKFEEMERKRQERRRDRSPENRGISAPDR